MSNTVKFHQKDHTKLRPPLLLRPLDLIPKCSFQYNCVSVMRPVHYEDHFHQVSLVVLLAGLHSSTNDLKDISSHICSCAVCLRCTNTVKVDFSPAFTGEGKPQVPLSMSGYLCRMYYVSQKSQYRFLTIKNPKTLAGFEPLVVTGK